MKNTLFLILGKYYYGAVFFVSLVFYIFFPMSPTPGIWDKVFIFLIGLLILFFYVFIQITIPVKSKTQDNDAIYNIALKAILVNLVIGISHLLVIMIFFDKTRIILVGIPYSIYSFAQEKLLILGFIYNSVFYFCVMFVFNRLLKDRAQLKKN